MQRSIHHFVTTKDYKGAVFAHLRARLKQAEKGVRARKNKVRLKYVPLDAHDQILFQDLQQSWRLLQLMCEGHNHQMQTLLRAQPNSQVSINLIQDGVDMLMLQVPYDLWFGPGPTLALAVTKLCP